MRIPDEQLNLFEQRLAAIGVGRRDFLKAVGAMVAGFVGTEASLGVERVRRRAQASQNIFICISFLVGQAIPIT
jgi:hypothetical protein